MYCIAITLDIDNDPFSVGNEVKVDINASLHGSGTSISVTYITQTLPTQHLPCATCSTSHLLSSSYHVTGSHMHMQVQEYTYCTECRSLLVLKLSVVVRTSYRLSDLFANLLDFAAKFLVVRGRLVYWLPVIRAE